MTNLPFSPIDAVVLVLVGFAAWSGYRAGFVATTYSLASWILAAAAAFAFEGPVAKAMDVFVTLPKQLETSIAFVAIILVVEMLFAAAAYVAVRPIVVALRRSPLSLIDRVLGIVPSVGRTLFIVAVLILAIEALPVATRAVAGVPDLMHHKYAIRDGSAVWTGSTNWTDDSWTRQENVIVRVLDAPSLAHAYTLDFEDLWTNANVEHAGRVEILEIPDGVAIGDVVGVVQVPLEIGGEEHLEAVRGREQA